MAGQQAVVGAGGDGDGVLSVVGDADEGGAGRFAAGNLVQHDTGVGQGLFQRLGKAVLAQGRQHMGGDAAGARRGDRLVGALAPGEGAEIAAQHGFTRGGDVCRLHHKVQICRASHQYHCQSCIPKISC